VIDLVANRFFSVENRRCKSCRRVRLHLWNKVNVNRHRYVDVGMAEHGAYFKLFPRFAFFFNQRRVHDVQSVDAECRNDKTVNVNLPKFDRRFFNGSAVLRFGNSLPVQPCLRGLLYCGNLRWRYIFSRFRKEVRRSSCAALASFSQSNDSRCCFIPLPSRKVI
jgi:hypothetical protein